MSDFRDDLFSFTAAIGDNTLILAQRLCAWVGHAPTLEEDIAIANVGLDLLGQTQNWYKYACDIEGKGRSDDDLAFHRSEREFRNAILVEQPNGNYGDTIIRQYLFDVWYYHFLELLAEAKDEGLAAISEKSLKEVAYHLDRSTGLILRLSDGTAESHAKMQNGLDKLWRYHAENCMPADYEITLQNKGVIPLYDVMHEKIQAAMELVFAKAGLSTPQQMPSPLRGKEGVHSEWMGHLISEMQYMQKSFPGLRW